MVFNMVSALAPVMMILPLWNARIVAIFFSPSLSVTLHRSAGKTVESKISAHLYSSLSKCDLC